MPVLKIFLHPCDVALLNRMADATVLGRAAAARRVWVVTPETGVKPADYLPGWRFALAGPRRLFAGQIWEGKLTPPTPPPS